MKKAVCLALLIPLSVCAKSCIEGDTFTLNKSAHFAGTALVAFGVGQLTDNPWYGLAAGLGVGAVRELYKQNTPGLRCEWMSMAYDLGGSALGAYGAHWMIQRRGRSTSLVYSREF